MSVFQAVKSQGFSLAELLPDTPTLHLMMMHPLRVQASVSDNLESSALVDKIANSFVSLSGPALGSEKGGANPLADFNLLNVLVNSRINQNMVEGERIPMCG